MKSDYTHITVVLDRSGSMEAIRTDTIGGFNAFLKKQKGEPGTATLTLVQFDTQDPYEVIHQFRPVTEIPELTPDTFVPRASTPLLDAMGRAINDLGRRLSALAEEQRPSRVVMVIITDGQENSSTEFPQDQIGKMVKEQQEKYNWQFVFLSADLAAIVDALDTGVQAKSSMAFDKTAQGTASAWSSASDRISDFRASRSKDVSFSDQDRSRQKAEKKRKA